MAPAGAAELAEAATLARPEISLTLGKSTISMRRFSLLPASVALGRMGSYSLYPAAVRRLGLTPDDARNYVTVTARAVESSQLLL